MIVATVRLVCYYFIIIIQINIIPIKHYNCNYFELNLCHYIVIN